jgi:hypothetical protein
MGRLSMMCCRTVLQWVTLFWSKQSNSDLQSLALPLGHAAIHKLANRFLS